MIAIQLSGTVSKAPETRTTQKGGQFAFTTVRVSSADGDQYLNVTCWDSALVETLTSLKQGDPVTVIGSGKLFTWTDRGGNTRPSLGVTASRIIAMSDTQAPPRQSRRSEPGDRRHPPPSAPMPALAQVPATAELEFSDDVPF